jgi:pimeloyl-ACP methyl ester carboxylesterase
MIYCARDNEGLTAESIGSCGERLAQEILRLARGRGWEELPIVLVGFSMGGLIIRAALPRLEELRPRLLGLVTIATPHLGYLVGAGTLTNLGLWFLKKDAASLQEMCFSDSKTLEGCLLYRLALEPGLDWFRWVVLLSSAQDQYAPWHSVRIMMPGTFFKDEGHKCVSRMANALQQRMEDRVTRVDVKFTLDD